MMFGGGGWHGGGWWSYINDDQSDRPTFSRAILTRVAAYARPYRGRIAGMLGTMMVSAALGLISPLIVRDLIDNALPNGDGGRLNLLALAMIGTAVALQLVSVLQRYLNVQVGEGIIFDLRRAVYAHMQRQSLRFFTNSRTGELMSRLNSDVVGAQNAITGTAVSIVSDVVRLVATLAIMLALEWRLTLLSILVLPLFILPARRVAVLLRRLARDEKVFNAQLSALSNETLNVSGALLVKLFGRTEAEKVRYADRAAAVRDIGIKQSIVSRWFFMALSLVSAVGTALIFWLGGHFVLQGVFTVGTIVAFVAYLGQLYGPLQSLSNVHVELARTLVSFERVFEVLDLPVEIDDRPDAIDPGRVLGRVEFDAVSFAYGSHTVPMLREPERRRRREVVGTLTGEMAGERAVSEVAAPTGETRWALRDVSFVVEPGQLAALVGPSGAGKTTITYLLPRLYDPTDGRILLDGYDLRNLRLASLADNIGMVTQETYLFHDTIRANLLYARPDATQAQIEEAARAANIHDFIADLPDGYDTVVGERGYRLSGGEKQRVAIARVLLKDPRILVLDEATSHLDSQSESLIQSALERVMAGRTSIVIAHRLSTILKADVILVMDKGRLVERGSHRELIAKGGLYARLYEIQFAHLTRETTRLKTPLISSAPNT